MLLYHTLLYLHKQPINFFLQFDGLSQWSDDSAVMTRIVHLPTFASYSDFIGGIDFQQVTKGLIMKGAASECFWYKSAVISSPSTAVIVMVSCAKMNWQDINSVVASRYFILDSRLKKKLWLRKLILRLQHDYVISIRISDIFQQLLHGFRLKLKEIRDVIDILRNLQILGDAKDLTAFINLTQSTNSSKKILNRYRKIEVAMHKILPKNIKISMRQLNQNIIDSDVEQTSIDAIKNYNPPAEGTELYVSLLEYFTYYNTKRRHLGIDNSIPQSLYRHTQPDAAWLVYIWNIELKTERNLS